MRPAITYAWRAGALYARGQKTFILYSSNYIDTQGRGALGPEKRGLERLFNITSNYVTARWREREQSRTANGTVNPQTRIELDCVVAYVDG